MGGAREVEVWTRAWDVGVVLVCGLLSADLGAMRLYILRVAGIGCLELGGLLEILSKVISGLCAGVAESRHWGVRLMGWKAVDDSCGYLSLLRRSPEDSLLSLGVGVLTLVSDEFEDMDMFEDCIG